MPEFLVVSVNTERRLVALVDRFRQYHVGVSVMPPPPLHAKLGGPAPGSGLSLLSEHQTGRFHPMRFVATRCSQATALEMLHETAAIDPCAARAAPPAATAASEGLRSAERRDPCVDGP